MKVSKTSEGPSVDRTAVIQYEKKFAMRGMLCGLLMFLGTPWLLLMYYESFRPDAWMRLFPTWIGPVILCLGMGGGVFVIVASVLFGLLIPTRVTQQACANPNCDPPRQVE